MASFSGLGIGLGSVIGCMILGLAAQLYYLLWWKKKRITNTSTEEIKDHHHHHYYYTTITNYAKELSHLFSWKKPNSVDSTTSNKTQQVITNSVSNPEDAINGHEPDLELGSSTAAANDLQQRGFEDGEEEEEEEEEEEGVESELMRLHSLCGPPRFLFTIKEETKEDLESDDGKSRKRSRTRSLSDILVAVETPMEFNPLFESLTEAELDRLRSSPPPKFKFLRDAEEKLMRRLMEEAEKMVTEERDGSFIRIVVGTKNDKEREILQQLPQCHSTTISSQILPLASFPSTFRPPLDSNQPIQP